MNSDNFMQTAHLLLGLTRKELERRMHCGQIDPQILKAQIEQNSQDTKLDALCEKWMNLRSLEQVDKFSADE
ncbi:MAG: hypothetical protein ABL930_06290 [Pseudobdellovibrio sp.]